MATESNEPWIGYPSQLTAFRFYFVGVLIFALLIWATYFLSTTASLEGLWYFPLIGIAVVAVACLFRYYIVRTTKYTLTSERLIREHGVLNRVIDDIELYRVRDYTVEEPILLRVFGKGHLVVTSTDVSDPELRLLAIPRPEQVRNRLRKNVEAARDKKRVHHLDVDRA